MVFLLLFMLATFGYTYMIAFTVMRIFSTSKNSQ